MFKTIILSITVLLLSSCASSISSYQRDEYNNWEAKGLAVEEKSEAAAVALGLLPGFGSLYTRNYGIAFVNAFFWPLSIIWEPISGMNGAESINYYATKTKVNRLETKEMRDLEDKFMLKQIDQQKYIIEKRRIEDKYQGSSM